MSAIHLISKSNRPLILRRRYEVFRVICDKVSELILRKQVIILRVIKRMTYKTTFYFYRKGSTKFYFGYFFLNVAKSLSKKLKLIWKIKKIYNMIGNFVVKFDFSGPEKNMIFVSREKKLWLRESIPYISLKVEITTYLSQGSKWLFLLAKSYPIESTIQQLLNIENIWLLFTTNRTYFSINIFY